MPEDDIVGLPQVVDVEDQLQEIGLVTLQAEGAAVLLLKAAVVLLQLPGTADLLRRSNAVLFRLVDDGDLQQKAVGGDLSQVIGAALHQRFGDAELLQTDAGVAPFQLLGVGVQQQKIVAGAL